MKFPYRKIRLDDASGFFGGLILKPIIPVKISAGNCKELNYEVLIDSGADFCIFDADVGEYLGIDINSGEKITFGGIQDRKGAAAFMHKVVLNIGGWSYSAIVGFSHDIAKQGFGVLGQKGFFDNFVVKFDLNKEEIELREKIR
ncbi:MAG: Uncharacterized protein CEN90_16 [Parcubacteria group bacterium Licking1014_17]|nr:MAG: Uncharacterized protein CEN90_16 [Parcubacteria group bacterium Licking1014_17]